MQRVIALFLWLVAMHVFAENIKVHVFVDADNTLCNTETLQMNSNLMRVLSYFGISKVDMLTRMDYRGAPGTKMCFRQMIKRELEAAVPAVKFGAIYTPHDAAIAQHYPRWQMGALYESYLGPIETAFSKLLETKEFLFQLALDHDQISLRSKLYQKYRGKEAPQHWARDTKTRHAALATLLSENKLFYDNHALVDWESATKGHAITYVMNQAMNDDPDTTPLVLFIDDSSKERDDVSLSLTQLTIRHLVTAPPHMRTIFTQRAIYNPIGMFLFQLAVTLKRLPHFSHNDFDAVVDLAQQDIEANNYREAMFILGLLHRSLPHRANELEPIMADLLSRAPQALSIFDEPAFQEIDLSLGHDEMSHAQTYWEYLAQHVRPVGVLHSSAEMVMTEHVTPLTVRHVEIAPNRKKKNKLQRFLRRFPL